MSTTQKTDKERLGSEDNEPKIVELTDEQASTLQKELDTKVNIFFCQL